MKKSTGSNILGDAQCKTCHIFVCFLSFPSLVSLAGFLHYG